jgi:hypothetical protein
MLDGRIDAQGTVQDLRARGMLDHIAHDASAEAHNEEVAQTDEDAIKDGATEGAASSPTDVAATASALDTAKKPRKLVKEEHRETGGVKWSIYKSYLKASCVHLFLRTCALIADSNVCVPAGLIGFGGSLRSWLS